MSGEFLNYVTGDDIQLMDELVKFFNAYKGNREGSHPPSADNFAFAVFWLKERFFGEDVSPAALGKIMSSIDNLYNRYPETCRRLLSHEKARIVDAVYPGGGDGQDGR